MRRALVAAAVVVLALVLWLVLDEPPVPASTDATRRVDMTAAVRPARRFDDDESGLQRAKTDDTTGARDAGGIRFDAGLTDDALARDAKEKFETVAKAQVLKWLDDNAKEAAKQVDAYCKATKEFAGQQDKIPRKSDAALFMAGRSDWEEGRLGLLHLPDALTERMRNPPLAWRRLGPDAYAGLDFGWMKKLLQFDHWSIVTASPLRDVAETRTYADAPLPNFVTLQSWAKLRLLKGLHENDLPQASVEVRHLAQLVATTGSLVGDMIRIALLGIERGFLEEHHLTLVPAMTADEAFRLRHSNFAAKDFLLPGVDTAVREKAMKCMPNRCTALAESIGSTAMVRDLVPQAGEHLTWLLQQPQCDPELAQLASRFKPMTAPEILDSYSANTLEESMRALLDAGTP